MDEVADGIFRCHSHGVVNWYLLVRDGRLAAIDAGFPPDWDDLVRTARQLGRSPGDLEAVVLTHGHVDHVGFAERARRGAGARVYVHEADAPIVRRPTPMARSERSPLLYLGHGATRKLMLTVLRTGAFRSQRVEELTTFGAGETLADVPGAPRVVFAPGHSDGACALLLDGVLFTGDALVMRDPYTGERGPHVVARAATADAQRALASLEALAETGAELLLPGHGDPWHGSAAEAVAQARAAGVA